jgi:rifampicin phosphotransferase
MSATLPAGLDAGLDAAYWQRYGDGWYLGQTPSARFPLYTRGNAGEVFPEVNYPLSYTLSAAEARKAFETSGTAGNIVTAKDIEGDPTALVGVFGGYSYLNASVLRLIAVRSIGITVDTVDQQYLGASEAPPFVRRKGDRSAKATLNSVRYGLKVLAAKSLPQQATDVARLEAWRTKLPSPTTASDRELMDATRGSQAFLMELFTNHLLVSGQAAVPIAVLASFCEKKCKDPSLLPRLLGGAGDVASAAPSTALWRLGRQVRADSTLTALFDAGVAGLVDRLRGGAAASEAVRSFNASFDAFLGEFGARGPNEWETACPTWGTDPELALALVDRMRAGDNDHDPVQRQSMLVADREAAMAQAVAKAGKRSEKRLKKLVASCALFAQGRERAKTTVVVAIHEVRLLSRELGRRCAARSGGRWDDLWFVTADELDGYVADPSAFTVKISERRRMRELLSSKEPPFLINGTVPDLSTWRDRANRTAPPVKVGERLSGISGCAGVARGRARVILSPSDPKDLGPGDVLIAPLTDPSWTPLFVPVEAVIVDVGAMMSHAVIVSRELGIPSVVSVTDATLRIPDGALVEVDGTNGVVTVLELPS